MSIANAIHAGVKVAHDVTNNGGMQVTFTREPTSASLDKNGRSVHGSAVTMTGLLHDVPARVLDDSGNERTSTTQLVVLGKTVFDPQDKITLPGSVVRPLVRCDSMVDSADVPYVSVLYFS
mgnify:CR=1 FL=1